MSDILIRGVEMPTTCSECYLCYDYMMCRPLGISFYSDDESFDCCEERLKECPLVELPEHGDLIDRDDAVFFMGSDGDFSDFQKGWDNAVHCLVIAAKTIIPADKE